MEDKLAGIPPSLLSVNIKFNSLRQWALYGAVIVPIIHLVLSGASTRWSLIQDLAAAPLTATGCSAMFVIMPTWRWRGACSPFWIFAGCDSPRSNETVYMGSVVPKCSCISNYRSWKLRIEPRLLCVVNKTQFLLRRVQSGSGTLPASSPMNTRNSFHRRQSDRGVNLSSHRHLVSR